MISIDNYDFKGKRAIIRVDFNVPVNEKGEVTDDTRICLLYTSDAADD